MTDQTDGSDTEQGESVDLTVLGRPGVHEVVSDDPVAEAERISAALDGELLDTETLVSSLDRRAAAADDPAARLLAARARAEAADQTRTLTDISALGALARSLARAERIAAGTKANMVESVGQRVSGGGLALHPDSIRSAAHDLLSVRREVTEVEAELAELTENSDAAGAGSTDSTDEQDPLEVPGSGPVEGEDREASSPGRLPLETKWRIARVIVMTVGLAMVGGAVLALMIGPLALGMLVFPILGVRWAIEEARIDLADVADKETASDNLARISANTDALFGVSAGSDKSGGIPASPGARVQLVTGRLELVRERERSAAGHWGDLAGAGADPHDVERVLRERDPQYFAAIEMVDVTSQARATEAHLRRVRARWNVAWAALDRDAPPPSEAEEAVHHLVAEGVRSVQVVTRRGTEDDVERAGAELAQRQSSTAMSAMVLADVTAELSDQMIERLAEVADTTPVVIVTGVPPTGQ